MSKKIGHHLFIILPLLFLVNTLIRFIKDGISIEIIIMQSITFVILIAFAVINLKIKSGKIQSIIFFLAACFTALLTTRSNLTSLFFLFIALIKQPRIKYHFYYIPIVFLCIVINFLVNSKDINDFFNYIIIYSGALLFYYLDIRNRYDSFVGDKKVDKYTLSVLFRQIRGYTIKEIEYEDGKTYSAIAKSLERARKNIDYDATHSTLVYYCSKNGLFEKVLDKEEKEP